MASLSLPAAEREKSEFPSAVPVWRLVGSLRITQGRKREWRRCGTGSVAGREAFGRLLLRTPPSGHTAPLWTPQTLIDHALLGGIPQSGAVSFSGGTPEGTGVGLSHD